MIRNWILFVLVLPAISSGQFAADLDGDRYVGISDLALIAAHWLATENPLCSGDIGTDCQVDLKDIAVLSSQWQWMECVSTATASSQENASLSASNAIDSNMSTRWSSAFADNQWLQIDFGRARSIYGLTIYWEGAYARVYEIQVSDNAVDWTTLYTESNGSGGTDEIAFTERTMTYLRIRCVTRATQWGSSIYEVTVKSNDKCQAPASPWRLIWSDEFEGPSLNMQNWSYETGTGSDGWGNWEWQYYTNRPQNCRIENGVLILEARKENYGGRKYTSARINTQNKQSFQYGRIEARIKGPGGGEGIWPAFWMLGGNISSVGWPACGELDILEIMTDPVEAKGTIHYGSSNPYIHESNGGRDRTAGNLSTAFHVYAVEWDANRIRWYRDDVNFYTTSTWWSGVGAYPAPFNQPFYIILNFAVGAWWWDEGVTQATVSFPQQFQVDYVRVYEKTSP